MLILSGGAFGYRIAVEEAAFGAPAAPLVSARARDCDRRLSLLRARLEIVQPILIDADRGTMPGTFNAGFERAHREIGEHAAALTKLKRWIVPIETVGDYYG